MSKEVRCPTCGKVAKHINSKKYLHWYSCVNPSCNMVAFDVKEVSND